MLLPFVGGVHAHTDPALQQQQQPAEGIVSLGRLGPARGWSGSGFRCWLVRAEGAPTHGAGSYGKQPAAHRGGLGWTWQDKPRDCPRDSGGRAGIKKQPLGAPRPCCPNPVCPGMCASPAAAASRCQGPGQEPRDSAGPVLGGLVSGAPSPIALPSRMRPNLRHFQTEMPTVPGRPGSRNERAAAEEPGPGGHRLGHTSFPGDGTLLERRHWGRNMPV